MGKIPHELRQTIARNIRKCRMQKFPGRGGSKTCAQAFGVSPQQWSPWERGNRTPDEIRLKQIADFFGVTVELLRREERIPGQPSSTPPPQKVSTKYIPVIIVLPHLPDNIKYLYDAVHTALNGE